VIALYDPRQPLGPGVGHRPVPGQHRQAQRHHLRPQSPGRPRVHRPPHRLGRAGEFGDGEDRCGVAVAIRARVVLPGPWPDGEKVVWRAKANRQMRFSTSSGQRRDSLAYLDPAPGAQGWGLPSTIYAERK